MLKIEHVTKTYGEFVLDCTMEVLPGRVTGLVGRNGSGKSTTFKAALGLVRPDQGQVRILGKTPEELKAEDRERIGVVLADSGFSGYLTVSDIAAMMQAMYTKFDKEQFLRKAEAHGLPLKKKIREFSTGMQAKLKLLAAVSHGAEFLILDEPTAGLDVIAREEMMEILRNFMEEGEQRGILISSHISGDLEAICDDLYMIHEGKIVLHEDTDVLLSDYALLKVDAREYEALDKQYLLRVKQETYGYKCLTDQRQFYLENYPKIVIEKSSVDDWIAMMAKGEAL